MSSRVILKHDLTEFFRDEISEAQSHLGIELSQLIEFYLVNLLCEYTRTGATPLPGDEPLALLYKRALEATAAELEMPVFMEGYEPPNDHRLKRLAVTPDPGVIEVNVGK